GAVDRRSTQALLTPAAMDKIRQAQAAKLTQIQQQAALAKITPAVEQAIAKDLAKDLNQDLKRDLRKAEQVITADAH
ncbi:MAG TPA: hypothetical protein VJJ83_00555, partial [Candidatus Babeliales bacterium]|nr:hypothetical protein [Candidatus Babeliales bacterium]